MKYLEISTQTPVGTCPHGQARLDNNMSWHNQDVEKSAIDLIRDLLKQGDTVCLRVEDLWIPEEEAPQFSRNY